MASAFVQEIGAVSDGAAGSSITWTGSKTITAGNTLIVYMGGDITFTLSTITDNLGNSWSVDFSEQYDLHSLRLTIVRSLITNGGNLTSIAITHPATTQRIFGVVEFSGVVDPSAYNVNTGTSAAPSADVDFDAVDGIQLWVAGVTDATNNLGSFTPPSGYTQTPPAGWAVGTNYLSIPNGGVAAYRGILAAHRVGADAGSWAASAGASTMAWVTASALLVAPVTRPALAGISFDGVTIR